MYSVNQAAERLGVNRRHIYRLINDNELTPTNIARPGLRPMLRISEDELDRFLTRRRWSA